MRLACPSCQAAYEVPDVLVGAAGRRMRCVRCATEWIGGAPVPPPPREVEKPAVVERAAAPVAASPAGASAARESWSADRRPEPRPAPVRRTRGLTVALSWLLTFAVLGTAAAACYKWRAEVMTAWPPSQRVYAALGLR
jgi:predicted Zn finger-like uncharacterized protein